MMADKPAFLTLAEEVIAEDIEVLQEFFREEFLPLIKYREQQEREAFNRAYRELQKLEEEA